MSSRFHSSMLQQALLLLSGAAFAYAIGNPALRFDGDCPVAEDIVHTPFKNYKYFWHEESRQKCWWTAICLLEKADEARKQQFAATALVMGLIPLTLKDIAWPERRLVWVNRRQPFFIEVIVRALGLVPTEITPEEMAAATDGSRIVHWARRIRKRFIVLFAVISTIFLFASFFAIFIVEYSSKGASLGCPFPAFVLMWYLAALLPSFIHTWCARMRNRYVAYRERRGAEKESLTENGHATAVVVDRKVDPSSQPVRRVATVTATSQQVEDKAAEKIASASAVQGADEWWIVQLFWAIYYIGGTLIFSSIMAVTVVELLGWVITSFAVTGSSKMLALFLSLSFEDIPW